MTLQHILEKIGRDNNYPEHVIKEAIRSTRVSHPNLLDVELPPELQDCFYTVALEKLRTLRPKECRRSIEELNSRQ